MNQSSLLLAVVVPARNEEEVLPRCLSAIAASRDQLRANCSRQKVEVPTVRVIVVLDCCVDATGEIAAEHTGIEVVTSTAGRVGEARSQGISAVLASTNVPTSRIWIANTDADSAVPPEWLSLQSKAAEAGEIALLGAVRPDSTGLGEARLAHYLAGHPLTEAHHNVHGANLGVRADAYLAAGGFAHVATGEDVQLVAALRAAGLQPRSTSRGAVLTSSRLNGRAPEGYAEVLRALTV